MKKHRLLIIAISLIILMPLEIKAAVLYFEPASQEYQIGDTFIIESRVDTQGECINALNAELIFPQDILEAVDFSQGESILTLWAQLPKIDQAKGKITFAGGIPGGYCGHLPGDPGQSNLLGKAVFKVKNLGSAEIKFSDSSQLLLNDGFGSLAETTLKSSVISVFSQSTSTQTEEWQEELIKDSLTPEKFAIAIQKDPAIFNNQYFAVFSTQDKQTGIDYYLIKEGWGKWQKTQSPYLLADQHLQSIIKVKAVDKAGNAITVWHWPWQRYLIYLAALLILIIIIIWRFIKK